MGRSGVHIDWVILACSVVLTSLGLATLLSIDINFFWSQLIFAVIGIALAILVARIDFSIYPYFDRYIYFFCLLLLALSYLGPNVSGATRWLEIGGVRLQPSEFVKPWLLLSWASLLVRYPPEKWRYLLRHVALFLLPFGLVFFQPDLGNAIVYTTMWVGAVVLAGVSLWYVILAGGTLLVLLPTLYELLHDYQKLRILTFLYPQLDPQGAGYNALQSLITIGSGQWWGRGFARGPQSLLNFLPEHHTDFIFAAFSEEFGLIGALILLTIFLILLWRLLKRTREQVESPIAFIYGISLFMQLVTQVVINVGMNMGLVPITGITLPFVSAGGSSLLATWMGLGIFMATLKRRA